MSKKPTASKKATTWVRLPELATHYGVSRSTAYKWTMKGIIPCRRVPGGRLIFFDLAEVDRWLKNQPPLRKSRNGEHKSDPRVEGDGREG